MITLGDILAKSQKRLSDNECWPWKGSISTKGYARYSHKTVSRILYRMYVGELHDDEVIRHTCDNPPCVNWNHFVKGTQTDNIQDRQDRNRQSKGVDRWSAKLDEDDVFDIREAYASGHWTHKALAEIYGISRQQVGRIVNRVRWKG